MILSPLMQIVCRAAWTLLDDSIFSRFVFLPLNAHSAKHGIAILMLLIVHSVCL